MAPAVQTRAAGEQAVAVGHLDHVLVRGPGGHEGPGAAVLPQVDVVLGVEGHHPLARGAGGGVDADAVLHGLAHKAVGVSVPQVSLAEEGELGEVRDALDVVGGHALLLHLLPVVGHVLIDPADLVHQTIALPSGDLFPGRAFDLGLVVVFHFMNSFQG